MPEMTGSPTAMNSIELEIAGMTCASCAMRIEKNLNSLDGVNATVNYATEKAIVTVPAGYDPQALIAEVEKTGYTASLPQLREEPAGQPEAADPELTSLRNRLVGAMVLASPVILMAMIPILQFRYWQWASLALAAPVVVWAGRPFHAAAWANLKHGAATMDTLVSVGTLSAFLWSLYALFLGTAGEPGMRHPFELTVTRSDGAGNIYLEVAAGVTLFVLAGRYFENRSKRRAGAALRALLQLGAKDVAVLRPDGIETRVPIDQLAVGDEFVVRPGEKIATDGNGCLGLLGRGRLDAHRRVRPRRGRPGRPGHRCHGQCRRAAGRACHQGWRRHPAGTDGQARRGGPIGQGGGAAAGGPHFRRVRSRRHRYRRRHLRGVAWRRLSRHRSAYCRGRGAHHRLPVRTRAGDADRAAGRHGTRRSARGADQRTRNVGVHPQGRHDRARQDRNRDHRQDDAGRGDHRARRRPRDGVALRRGPGGRLGASHRPGNRQGRQGGTRSLARRRKISSTWKAKACKASSTGTPSSVGRASLLADWAQHLDATLTELFKPRPAPRAKAKPPSPSAGTAASAGSS